MNKLSLHWKIIIGIILGFVWAVSSSFLGWSEFTIKWISPFGDIFGSGMGGSNQRNRGGDNLKISISLFKKLSIKP